MSHLDISHVNIPTMSCRIYTIIFEVIFRIRALTLKVRVVNIILTLNKFYNKIYYKI